MAVKMTVHIFVRMQEARGPPRSTCTDDSMQSLESKVQPRKVPARLPVQLRCFTGCIHINGQPNQFNTVVLVEVHVL